MACDESEKGVERKAPLNSPPIYALRLPAHTHTHTYMHTRAARTSPSGILAASSSYFHLLIRPEDEHKTTTANRILEERRTSIYFLAKRMECCAGERSQRDKILANERWEYPSNDEECQVILRFFLFRVLCLREYRDSIRLVRLLFIFVHCCCVYIPIVVFLFRCDSHGLPGF